MPSGNRHGLRAASVDVRTYRYQINRLFSMAESPHRRLDSSRHFRRLVVACVLGAAGLGASGGAELETFFSNYCFACHDSDVQKAELNLESLMRGGNPSIDDAHQWETVLHMISTTEMPPKKKTQPKQVERDAASASITGMLQSWAETMGDNPGRVTVRRLNRDEYNKTIRDLLGIDFQPAKGFPRDEVGYGFDNIGDVLSLSPVLMEKYLDAAERIAESAIIAEIPEWPPVFRSKLDDFELLSWEEDLFEIPLRGEWAAKFHIDGGTEPINAILALPSELKIEGKRVELSTSVELEGASREVVVKAEERGAGKLIGHWAVGEFGGVFEADARAGGALVGKWEAIAKLPDGRNLKQMLILDENDDGELMGRVEQSDDKVMELLEVTVDGNALNVSYEVEIGGALRNVELRTKLTEGQLTGRWQIAGAGEAINGEWEARPKKKDAGDQNVRPRGRSIGFYREGEARLTWEAGVAGTYTLKFSSNQQGAGPEDAMLGLYVDGRELERIDIGWDKPEMISRELKFDAGTHTIALAYLNNYVNNSASDRRLRGDRNLFARDLEIVGPLGNPRPELPESHRRVIPSQPSNENDDSVAQRYIAEFASRAFRRPVREEEVDRIAKLYRLVRADGGTFNEGMRLAVQAILTSPHFLFRWELDSAHSVPDGIRNLNAYEIASRLSYFLWSSMPDDELFALAMDGSLREQNVIREQVRRMLADPRSDALVRNFAGQWLQVRNLETIKPDAETFPDFDDSLRHSMAEETYLFFNAVLRENRSALELIDSDFTFLNERLAKHYGFNLEVEGDRFQKIALPGDSNRGGVLGHAGILTLTSSPTRTSPVNRGKWVLEQILGTPPPPPPPDVPELEVSKEAVATTSLRDRMRLHRESPDCAGCHAKMDPIGFALENYDGIGRWRDFDGRFPIDPAGTLADGTDVSGPQSLKKLLRARPEFVNSLIEKMLTYALGRGMEFSDHREIERIRDKTLQKGFKLSEIVTEIACSAPFLKRSVEVAKP
jgi:hypothetical protein